jgi:hypothetical protein
MLNLTVRAVTIDVYLSLNVDVDFYSMHFRFCLLKVHKHEIFFLTFFAETETICSQGPVTRDFLKSYSNWQRYSTLGALTVS